MALELEGSTNNVVSRQGIPAHLWPALLPIVRKVFWWGQPEQWLGDGLRFAAQVMTYGDWDDVRTTVRLLGRDAFARVLSHPPPGVFDQKSWTFWHVYYGRPVPPMPVRILG
jgi:hypothetical protein